MSTDTNTQPQEEIKEVEQAVEVEETTEEIATSEESQQEEETLESVSEEPEVEEKPKPKEKPKTVPIEVFLELKKELKELKNKSVSTIDEDSSIEEIAEEFDVNVEFVNKLANAIKTSTVKDFEKKNEALLKQERAKAEQEKREKKFDELYAKSLEINPHLKDIANKEIIKQLALNPNNAKKTCSQLLEEVYGHTVQGKRTIETSQPNSSEKTESVDFTKAGDPAVYAKIKADPELRKQYNEFLIKNINL